MSATHGHRDGKRVARPSAIIARPRVLVTRAREQAGEVCALLTAAGLDPVCFPVIAPHPLADTTALEAAISHLHSYDWIVFVSANAFRFFSARMQALGRTFPGSLSGLGGIVAGPATATVLAQQGVLATIVPAPFSAQAALETMQPAVWEGSRVLLPRAELGRDLLARGLRARGCIVDELILYRTEASLEDAGEILRQIATRTIAAITFFSPSAVRAFETACAVALQRVQHAGASRPGTLARTGAGTGTNDARDALAGVLIACIGPTTALAAKRAGWHVDVIPPDTTAAALAAVLAERLAPELALQPVEAGPCLGLPLAGQYMVSAED